MVSWLQRVELWQQEKKQGSSLAAYADFRDLPVYSCSSHQGCVGAEKPLDLQTQELLVGLSLCRLGSPGTAVLPRGFKVQGGL